MPDLTAAELSIPAEQHPDPAKPLVIPVDSTVVGSTLRFIPWSVVGNPALLQLPPPPPGMQPSWVQIPQWVAISALLPFSEPEPAVATHFDRLSVLRLAVLAAAWRRILGALSDLGVFSTVHVDEDAFRTVCIQALHSRQIPVPELYLQWGDLGYSEAIVPLGPAPSAEAKAVDFLQYATVGALCDPTADVPFAALSDMTRCLGPVFTAAARVDPMGSAVVGAASLAAAAGHITPRASDGHPALLARHVLSMLKTTRSSFPACLRTNSFQNYSAEVETRAEYVGGTAVARDRVAEQRCPRAIAAKAPTLDALLRALPRPTPPSVVYEAYRQLVSLYFPTDRRPMDLLLTDLDAQLHARLPTYQHALTNGKPFASILAGLRKLHESLEPSRKAPVMTSTGDSEDSALGKFDRAPAGLPDNSLKADRGAPAAGRATNPSSPGRWGPIYSLVAASAVARRARRATARARARPPQATPMEAREGDTSQTSAQGCVAYSLGQRPGRPMQRRRPCHRRRWTSRCSRAAGWPLCLRPRAGRRDPRDPARSRRSRGTRIWPAPAPGATRPPSPRRRDCSGLRKSTRSFGAARAGRLAKRLRP